MELPYLKNKKNQGGGGPTETIRVGDNGTSNKQLLEMVTEELMDAFEKKDKGSFLHAFHALIQMIGDEDAAD